VEKGTIMPLSQDLQPVALSPADAAAFLSLSKKTIHRLIERGKLVAKKSGPRTLVSTESLQAYFVNLPIKPAVRS
jgi:excisionase family DNA binding protein